MSVADMVTIFETSSDPENKGPLANLNRVVQLVFGDMRPGVKDRPVLVQNDSEGVEIHVPHRGEEGDVLGSVYFKAEVGFNSQGEFVLNIIQRSVQRGPLSISRRTDYKPDEMLMAYSVPILTEERLFSQFATYIGENLPGMLPKVKAAMEEVFGKPPEGPAPTA